MTIIVPPSMPTPGLPETDNNKRIVKIVFGIFLGFVLLFIVFKLLGRSIEGLDFMSTRQQTLIAELQTLETTLRNVINNAQCNLVKESLNPRDRSTKIRNSQTYETEYKDIMTKVERIMAGNETSGNAQFTAAVQRARNAIPSMLNYMSSLPKCNIDCGTNKINVFGTNWVNKSSPKYCISASSVVPKPPPIPPPAPPGPPPPVVSPTGPVVSPTGATPLPPPPPVVSPTGPAVELIMRLNTLGSNIVKCIRPNTVAQYLNMLDEARAVGVNNPAVMDAVVNVAKKYILVKGVCDVLSTSEVNNLQRRGQANTWVDKQGNLWLFGGREFSGSSTGSTKEFKNDMWKNENGVWKQVMINSTLRPRPRVGGVTWVGVDGNLWLYGGIGGDSPENVRYSDMWKFNLSTSTWEVVDGTTQINMDTADMVNKKPGFSAIPVSYASNKGILWLLVRNELWQHNGSVWNRLSIDTWTRPGSTPMGNVPLWVDSKTNEVYAYVSSDCMNIDINGVRGNAIVTKWDGSVWKEVRKETCDGVVNPGFTRNATMYTWKDYDQNFYVYLDRSGEGNDAVWRLNRTNKANEVWELITNPELISMTGRNRMSTWNIGSQLYVYGGQFISATPKYQYGTFPTDLLVVTA